MTAERTRQELIRRAAERWFAMSADARRAEVSRSLARIFGTARDEEVDRLVTETDAHYRKVLESQP